MHTIPLCEATGFLYTIVYVRPLFTLTMNFMDQVYTTLVNIMYLIGIWWHHCDRRIWYKTNRMYASEVERLLHRGTGDEPTCATYSPLFMALSIAGKWEWKPQLSVFIQFRVLILPHFLHCGLFIRSSAFVSLLPLTKKLRWQWIMCCDCFAKDIAIPFISAPNPHNKQNLWLFYFFSTAFVFTRNIHHNHNKSASHFFRSIVWLCSKCIAQPKGSMLKGKMYKRIIKLAVYLWQRSFLERKLKQLTT